MGGENIKKSSNRFSSTDWSRLAGLKQGADGAHAASLDFISRRYWPPILHYLTRSGINATDAQDLVQGFFAFALRTRLFERADKEAGSFRAFLLTALKHYVANEKRRERSGKRRPAGQIGSLDKILSDPGPLPVALVQSDTPQTEYEAAFHRAWQVTVVNHTLASLEAECQRTGKTVHFALFKTLVVEPMLTGTPPPRLGDEAARFSLAYMEASNRVGTMKRGFIRHLRKEVAGYAGSPDAASVEEADILRIMPLHKIL